MSTFFTSGHAIDLILLVIAVEATWLVARRRTDVLSMLMPGILVLLATRSALTGGAWWEVAAWLAASLPAHLYDLRRRLSVG